ncbi:MAG: hypothetical protein JJE22_02630 [Bacteroidia bacterium]|nr:hypothetical protein [Bacteroidia bacterium]
MGDGTANKVKTDIALAYIYASSGTKEDARKIIEETSVNKILSGNDYRGIALIYTALGNYDKAFE